MIRLFKAIMVALLCAVMALSVNAGEKNKRASDGDSGKTSSAKRESDSNDKRTRDSDSNDKRSRNSNSDERSSRDADSSDKRTRETDSSDKRSRESASSDKRSRDTDQDKRKDDHYQPSPPPPYTYPQRNEDAGKHEQGYRPDTNWPRRDDNRDTNWDKRRADPQYYGHRDYNAKKRSSRVYRPRYYNYPSRAGYRPCHYGFWVFDNYDSRYSRRSVYFFYGFPYMQSSRVYVAPYYGSSYRRSYSIDGNGYYLSERNARLNSVLDDIREAWMYGKPELIEDHLSTYGRIAVLLDGNYGYSIDVDDYAQMTADALEEIRTRNFTWQGIRERADGDVTAFGRHDYYDARGAVRTAYITYTLHETSGEYVITEVGSSASPLM